MTILDTIIAHKKKEVADAKSYVSIGELEKSPFYHRECISLRNSLNIGHSNGIIAEFKRKSPSKGIINNTVNPVEVVSGYASAGVAASSILTDEFFFGGRKEDLLAVRNSDISIPLLRKEFIIDEYQLVEAKAIGADIILLIASCLTKYEVKKLASVAKNLGIEVLLELHEESEIEHINNNVDLVGINNRNLKTFEVNIENSIRMVEKIGNNHLFVAESGISTPEDVKLFKKNGFHGFLIGENFMKTTSPQLACKNFIENLAKI